MKEYRDGLTIKVVGNAEEQLKAFLVRGIVYMHEQNCPFAEEFDLNDFAATQILGTINGEPILTARIRYFQGYAKFERLAIRVSHRGRGYGHNLLNYMIWLTRAKGIRKAYLHAQKRLAPFYEGYGFKVIGKEFSFSDHEYLEMVCMLDANAEAINVGQNPDILNRPEGMFRRPGPIELGSAKENEAYQFELGKA